MVEPLNVQIASIPKNANSDLRVSLSEFKGARFVDLRIYSEFATASGQRSPTKQGVTCSFEHLTSLIAALQEAATEARTRGLLKGGGA